MIAAATLADIAGFAAVWVILAVIFGGLWNCLNSKPPGPHEH